MSFEFPGLPSISPLRILVTGAAGFIGSHTVEALLGQGHEVMGADDLSTGKRANLKDARARGCRLVDDDLLAKGVLDGVTASFRPDVIIHLAGLVSVPLGEERPHRNFRLNVEATQLVAETGRQHGVSRIVLGSSGTVYGDFEKLPWGEDDPKMPKSNYGMSKLVSEMILAGYAQSYGMTCVATRFFNVYGPRQDSTSPHSGVVSIFADRFRQRRQSTIFGDGSQTRDFVHVRDVARALTLAATRPAVASGAYNVCSGTRHSLLELTHLLAGIFPGGPDVAFAPERAGDIKHSLGDPARAAEQLGFVAEVSLRDGLRQLADGGWSEFRRAA